MRARGREPLQGVEDLPVIIAFRRIDDGRFVVEILHPFLREGCPDTGFAEDMNTAMSPGVDARKGMKMNGYPASWKLKDHRKRIGKTGPG